MAEAAPVPELAPVELVTPHLVATMLPAAAAARQVTYYGKNRRHLSGWEPPRPPGFYTEEFWRWRFAQNRTEFFEDRALRLQLVSRADPNGPVIGQVSFTELVRGSFHSCSLGYSMDEHHQGQGLMREALEHTIPFVFGRMGLHRVAASYMPTNERSGRLLRSLGFVVEGYARDYLFINGAWRDHVLTALVEPSNRPPGVRRT
jgi:[ribosomal protein S5]-alanine N-acetyltransferase